MFKLKPEIIHVNCNTNQQHKTSLHFCTRLFWFKHKVFIYRQDIIITYLH